MSFPKVIFFLVLALFGTIGAVAWFKHGKKEESATVISKQGQVESAIAVKLTDKLPVNGPKVVGQNEVELAASPHTFPHLVLGEAGYPLSDLCPETCVDRVNEFFNLIPPKFPIVETVTYRSRVSWLEGRPAWLADYATHYGTSRHFF